MTIYFSVGIATLVIIYWLIFYLFQRRWLYPLNKLPDAQGVAPSVAETHWIDNGTGSSELWWLPAVQEETIAQKPSVIVAHGQLGLIDTWENRMLGLVELGYNVLLVEFPGYGRSTGKPSEKNFAATFAAAYDWLVDQPQVDPKQIIGLGRSMGGGVICQLSLLRSLTSIWLLSTFTSLRPFIAKRAIPKFIQTEFMDNLAVVAQTSVPILVLHGLADDVVPATHGRALAQAAPH
ncbi:MAG: alpha/beta hydrolase, partial [Kangiellaceae bacterium]|nr:alpha/beta hydrolase [Kangiellaceae bacterium]